MPSALGTENAFVVLAEVNRLIREGSRHRLVLHRPARLSDADVQCRMPPSTRSAAEGTATRRRPASTNCARRPRDPWARCAASTSRADEVVVGAGAKPFIGYTIASVTDYGAGDEVIFPVPGFPIYESQIVANGAVPVACRCASRAAFAFDPAELAARIGPKTRLLILNTPHNPTGGVSRRVQRSRGDRRGAARAPQRLGLRRRDLQQARLRRRLRVDRVAARHARAHHHFATARRRRTR